jgi:membrane-associated phospholipid phosphatase
MRWNLGLLAICQLLLISNTAPAQKDSVPEPPHPSQRSSATRWIVPLGIAASAALDPEAREWSLRERSHSLDQLAKSVNPIGTAHLLVPAMTLTYAAALLTHQESLANGTLNTAAAYVASDIAESVLKPVIGRERPHVEGNSHRFHPFTSNGDWHSLPSAHVAHIASIAEAISMQSHSTSLTALCSGIVALVAWDRVYEDQHWTSDVTATVALTTFVSRATVGWLESRRDHH